MDSSRIPPYRSPIIFIPGKPRFPGKPQFAMVVNNPNNWHWVDKNCIDWTKRYFSEKLPGLGKSLQVSKVRSVEGDVEVCQRKGKVISLFDLKLVLALQKDSQNVGTVTIPEVAYDTEQDEYQFNISLDEDNEQSADLKKEFRSEVEPVLREALAKFGVDLLTTHGSDIQLPESEVSLSLTRENQKSVVAKAKPQQKSLDLSQPKSLETSSTSDRFSPNTSTLHIESTFTTTADQLFETLTDPGRVAAWTRAPPVLEPKVGGKYALFHGNIQGEFLKLERPDRLVMTWRLQDWKESHFAKLEIKFFQGEGETKMDVMFTGIPIGEEEKVEGNFEEYYLRAIKLTFGFGIVL